MYSAVYEREEKWETDYSFEIVQVEVRDAVLATSWDANHVVVLVLVFSVNVFHNHVWFLTVDVLLTPCFDGSIVGSGNFERLVHLRKS